VTPARIWAASIALLVLGSVLFMYVWTSAADPDLWGHVRFGEDFLRTHEVARADIYSYLTSTSLWVNHEWLAEAAFAWAYDRAGAPGLIGLKVAVAMLASFVALLHLTRQGLNPLPAGLWLMLAEHLMLPGLGSLRPQMFTCLFLVCTLVILDSAERRSVKWLWVLPPMFALWANFHGGILAGGAVVLVWAGGHAVARAVRPRLGPATFSPLPREVLLPVGLAFAATLINPYGLRLWWFLRTALVPRHEIAEWNPLPMTSLGGAAYVLLATLGVAGIVLGKRSRSPGLMSVFFVALLLPLLAVRHTPLFAIVALLTAGPHVADMLARRTGQTFPPPTVLTPARIRLAAVFAACSGILVIGSIPKFGCIAMDDSFPVGAVARVKQAGVTGNMVVHFDWGEYALWHVGPAVKVSVDGRRETLYNDAIYGANMRFEDGIGEWNTLLQDRSVTMVLANKRFPSFNLMRLTPGWELVQEDDLDGLFGRSGSDALQRLKDVGRGDQPLAGRLCFP
jgi:hypothetical protein